MNVIAGVIFHFIGGFASGSFYIPFKKVKAWAWESYWIVGGFFSWLIVPSVAAYFTVPDFLSIIQSTNNNVLLATYFMGVLWGIGGLTFGLAMRYLGMSLGMSIALGYCSAFGALIPPIYRDLFTDSTTNTFSFMLKSSSGLFVLGGILVCLIGISICGKAGAMKENELSDEQKRVAIREFNLWKGIAVATVSGILSACFNFGIEAGKPMAEVAVQNGNNPLFQNNVTFVVLLWGGITTNFIWCMILNARNKTFGDYLNQKTPLASNYIFAAVAGTTWFLQFFFYGMGESKLGNGASSWILHMASIILVSNAWGIILNEWKGVSKKTFSTILTGIAIIILSVLLVGYGNYLNE
jgi:L-rhamnose-H+ transport protein